MCTISDVNKKLFALVFSCSVYYRMEMSEAKVRLAYKLWFFLVVVGLEKGGCEFTHFVLDAYKIV